MKLLVTGSRGFIGGSVGTYAAALGHQLLGTGRSDSAQVDWPGEYVRTDGEPLHLARVINEFAPDAVVHAAGSASVSSSVSDPLPDFHDSVSTCANLLEAVRLTGQKPVIILLSSAAVFGNPSALPINEDTAVNPISPYGFHKAMCELLAREYAECFDLNIVVCRFFSVFGATQRRLLIWELHKQLIGPEQTTWLEGTGSESRDFLHIDDVTSAIVRLIESKRENSSAGFLLVNVGSGTETDVLKVAEQLRDIVAPHKDIRCRGNVRKNDPTRWCADVSRLRELLGSWEPSPLSEGLAKCVKDWSRENWGMQHGA